MENQYLDIAIAPADTAFGLMADFDADPHPNKVSLIAGAYHDEDGNPWVLPSVRKAKEWLGETTHEYLGIAGSPLFIKLAQDLIFGPVASRLDNIASMQTVSVSEYPYYSSVTKEIDMVGMLNALEQAEPNDVVILQACAHNPTRIDLSKSQWMQVAELVRRKKLFVVFDSAYQGFATGDIDGDAWAVRHFMDNVSTFETHPGLCVAQSFSKNFGLYGERVGALHLVVPRDFSARGALSELSAIARAEYSNPPRFGSRIVETILEDGELTEQWKMDLETMSSRIRSMRREMRQRLEMETGKDWAHFEKQIGMFSYTGLRKEQVCRLRDEFHVYLLPSGRMSLCGLNDGNVQYVAYAIGQVIKS
ncbi:hypothetical protein N7490_009572 [Penicillium lividum]|nr:hypothetical protein N7490_009572 [Penicillium lividum]